MPARTYYRVSEANMAFSAPVTRPGQVLRLPRPDRARRRLRELAGHVASLCAPARVPLSNLTHYPLFATGAGLIDFAAFHVGHGWGWLATGISLMVIEHVIADET